MRSQTGAQLQHEIAVDTARWGIRLSRFHQGRQSVARSGLKIFHTIAARLERAKADIEDGRQRVALLRQY